MGVINNETSARYCVPFGVALFKIDGTAEREWTDVDKSQLAENMQSGARARRIKYPACVNALRVISSSGYRQTVAVVRNVAHVLPFWSLRSDRCSRSDRDELSADCDPGETAFHHSISKDIARSRRRVPERTPELGMGSRRYVLYANLDSIRRGRA